MISRGAFPVVTIGEEHEDRLLEAPADEATSPGGLHGPDAPYVEIALAGHALGLDEALAAWDAEIWGANA